MSMYSWVSSRPHGLGSLLCEPRPHHGAAHTVKLHNSTRWITTLTFLWHLEATACDKWQHGRSTAQVSVFTGGVGFIISNLEHNLKQVAFSHLQLGWKHLQPAVQSYTVGKKHCSNVTGKIPFDRYHLLKNKWINKQTWWLKQLLGCFGALWIFYYYYF